MYVSITVENLTDIAEPQFNLLEQKDPLTDCKYNESFWS